MDWCHKSTGALENYVVKASRYNSSQESCFFSAQEDSWPNQVGIPRLLSTYGRLGESLVANLFSWLQVFFYLWE